MIETTRTVPMLENGEGRYVRILRSGSKAFFETTKDRVSFDFRGLVNGIRPVGGRYHICRSGNRPTLFFVERPGAFVLSSCAIENELLEWPDQGDADPLIRVERSISGGGEYCRWIYTAKNGTDDSVSGQVNFYHSDDVDSRASFNLGPAGTLRCESEINIIISIDENAHVTSQVFFRNRIYRCSGMVFGT